MGSTPRLFRVGLLKKILSPKTADADVDVFRRLATMSTLADAHVAPPDYSSWSTSALVSRVQQLEKSLAEATSLTSNSTERPKKDRRAYDATRYSTRLIALKFAYLGGKFGGFEYHNKVTPLPTIEEKLFSALLKARLVPANPDCCNSESAEAWPGDEITQYSKCGRTDRGVSAFGQVVGVRVRSNRPLPKIPTSEEDDESIEETEFDESKELPYAQILNRLLPPEIRILAWCPNPPPTFSARFDCLGRQYRYFFSNPAFPPTPDHTGELDIAAMRDAAARFLGHHDFRNFCKLDPSKQIDNFDRLIFKSEIEEIATPPPQVFSPVGSTTGPGQGPKWYSFTLHGTAFLWHQVRHMMAILFLVGQGLEKPSIATEMLDLSIFPRKPSYEMADDRPLILWDCIFRDETLKWLPGEKARHGVGARDALVDSVWSEWRRSKIDELQSGMLLDIVAKQSPEEWENKKDISSKGHVAVLGGAEIRRRDKHQAMRNRNTQRDVAEINRSWAERKGEAKMNNAKGRAARMALQAAAEAAEKK